MVRDSGYARVWDAAETVLTDLGLPWALRRQGDRFILDAGSDLFVTVLAADETTCGKPEPRFRVTLKHCFADEPSRCVIGGIDIPMQAVLTFPKTFYSWECRDAISLQQLLVVLLATMASSPASRVADDWYIATEESGVAEELPGDS